MIKNTFVHLKGKNLESEKKLWAKKIFTWSDYVKNIPSQLSLLANDSSTENLDNSFKAFEQADISFFSNMLHHYEYYRLALSFPEKVMFVDIETTGLSLYYDSITLIGWSIGKEYGIYIQGQDSSTFLSKLKEAQIIVTFNGTMFDLKFIKKAFTNASIPQTHIDLRFFCKRMGLSGGQKSIEKELGFLRNENLNEMDGETAPILWYKYKNGSQNALKTLIEYNHADVEGMKFLFDECIKRQLKKLNPPKEIKPTLKFRKLASQIKWCKNIELPEYNGSTKPLITYQDLNTIVKLDNICIVGIDLVSSETRETGVCILNGANASTCRIKTDDELIRIALDAKATLVSIDSPLSIPKGRTSFWDDDPMRSKYGITRECERILKKRGISSYPCLIPSMQKLTQRGMMLADKFRKLGIAVIESYPGAAQDIMNIPRKQSGLEHLTNGLRDFGIVGDFLFNEVSHDELDAITSAIVGHFFWTGKYEGLGNVDEDYLIIPDLGANSKKFFETKVIGISGGLRSGKTTLGKELASKGWEFYSYSDALVEMLKKGNIEITRTNLQKLGWDIHNERGQRWLGNKLLSLYKGTKIAIAGLRFAEDHAFLREQFGSRFNHVHLDTPFEIRQNRVGESRENISIEEAESHPIEQNMEELSQLSDKVLDGNQAIESFFHAFHSVL